MSAGSAYVLLEDGARFGGEAAAADGPVTGEVVTFTYPHVGNYGVSGDAMESDRVHARAVIMRAAVNAKHGRSRRPAGRPLPLEDALAAEGGWLDWLRDCGVPAITGVDTRALVRHLRDRGAMRGGIFPADLTQDEAADRVMAEPPMAGQDLAREVSPDRVLEVGSGDGPRIAAIDTGIKQSIVHNLVARGARVALHPCTATPDDLLASDPDAIFLANGPGDPAALSYVVETVRALVGRRPVWGICLGHQLLCRAVGLETFKLPFGHRGANHPVKDLETGRIEITSQNHGFAVLGPDGAQRIEADEPVRWETDFGAAQLSHVNLYDRTVEGLTMLDVRGGTVQYHPEAGPGPHDSLYLFDRFLERIVA